MRDPRRVWAISLTVLLTGAWGALPPLPALADQTNPAGSVISGCNPGLEATADDETLTNAGRIEVSGTDEAVGMGILPSRPQLQGLSLINHGFVHTSARGGQASSTDASADASAYAYGLYGRDAATLTNHGSVHARATGGRATSTSTPAYVSVFAAGLRGNDSATLTNHGFVHASATGGQATATSTSDYTPADANAYAYGLYGQDSATVTNSGFVHSSAMGGQATSTTTSPNAYAKANAYAHGLYGGNAATVTNYGFINVTATGGQATAAKASASADAYGLRGGHSATLTNYGVIRVSARGPAEVRAHELFADGTSGGDPVRVTAWALHLRDFSNSRTRPFGVDTGSLDFSGSTLIPRPGPTSQGFAWGREYPVTDMVTSYSGGSAQGSVAAVVTEMPLLEARLTGADWRDQRVSLHPRVTAATNPGQIIASLGVALARARMDALGSVLAAHLAPSGGNRGLAAGDASDSRWSGFMTPFVSRVSRDKPDYRATGAGLAVGGDFRFSDRFAAGVHAGFEHADFSGDLMDLDGQALTGFAGLHGLWTPSPAWYLRGRITGFVTHADQDQRGGRPEYPLTSEAAQDSSGLFAALDAGYVWRIDARNSLAPELGLAGLWTRQDGYALHWTGRGGASLPGYDMDFGATEYAVLDATARLRWGGDFTVGGGSLSPTLAVGLRQALTDNAVKSRLRFGGGSFTTRAGEDDASVLAEAGLAWRRDNVGLELAYSGAYGARQKSHAGWLSVRLAF